jgi:hypothetical protein
MQPLGGGRSPQVTDVCHCHLSHECFARLIPPATPTGLHRRVIINYSILIHGFLQHKTARLATFVIFPRYFQCVAIRHQHQTSDSTSAQAQRPGVMFVNESAPDLLFSIRLAPASLVPRTAMVRTQFRISKKNKSSLCRGLGLQQLPAPVYDSDNSGAQK